MPLRKRKFMNPIVLAGLAAFLFMGKKKAGATTSTAPTDGGTTTTVKPNIPGSPSLTIDEIHDRPGQFLDNVKYTFTAGGKTFEGKHRSRDEAPQQEIVDDFMVVTQTDPNVREGEKKPDVVMIVVKDRNNRTVIAKRIIIGEKRIVDIQ